MGRICVPCRKSLRAGSSVGCRRYWPPTRYRDLSPNAARGSTNSSQMARRIEFPTSGVNVWTTSCPGRGTSASGSEILHRYYNESRTHLWLDKMRPSRVLLRSAAALLPALFLADCIINIAGRLSGMRQALLDIRDARQEDRLVL